jgi:hypothetical protein
MWRIYVGYRSINSNNPGSKQHQLEGCRMSWLLFYLLAALHPVAFLVIAWRCETWKQRLVLWALLPLPAVLYCWDYFAIKNEHVQMCAAEGGLKVLIQPEKVDRVRFVGDSFNGLAARATLEAYFPQAQLVEAMTDARGSNGKRLAYYESYTATTNPKASPEDKGPFQKEPKLLFEKQKVVAMESSIYEISVREVSVPNRSIKETILSKQGKVYAKHTEIVHWWSGIRYPDAVPTWRCPDNKTPSAYMALRELIFK